MKDVRWSPHQHRAAKQGGARRLLPVITPTYLPPRERYTESPC